MNEPTINVNPDLVLKFAGQSYERWQSLVGSNIQHQTLGYGTIAAISGNEGNITLEILFQNQSVGEPPRKFAPVVLKKCTEIFLTTKVAQEVARSTAQVPNAHSLAPSLHSKPPKSQALRLAEEGKTDTINTALPASRFHVGQEVMVRNEPFRRGLVNKPPFMVDTIWQYEVFFSAEDRQVFKETDLKLYESSFKWGGLSELLRDLALVKLKRPLREHLYALYSSRTKFEVYQFKPVLKFLANPDQRLLIADEVGLGKTIEAGIIYLELQARLDVNRVLVVCPSGLRHKWQGEMRQRFDEEFSILDIEAVRHFFWQYGQFGESVRLRGIVSLELLRRKELVDTLTENRIAFDLVIIDEAHHCRNSSTRAHELASTLSDNADAMLLLTATPLQIGNEDLFNLLRILNPGEFDDSDVFLDRLEPNKFVNRAAQILATGDHRAALRELRKIEGTNERNRFLQNPYYSEITRLLTNDFLRRDELIRAQRKIVELNTLAQVFTRTRKREIAEKVPARAAFVLNVQFNPVEARFYQLVVEYTRQEFMRLHGTNYAIGWVSVMRERQTASCISAARERFEELAREAHDDILEEGFFDPNVIGDLDEEESINGRHARIKPFRGKLPERYELEQDTKFDVFWTAIEKVLLEDNESKVIVFSFFIATVEHLYKQLRQRGVTVMRLHGNIKVQERQTTIDEFRQNSQVRVLVSSDVGSEGLDFQFCNTIFNYDLPWNPMRLEQRIGRIDRFGQESPRIRIYNMVIKDSIESRILMRLYERIGIFQTALGDLEAILGEEIRELTRVVYTRHLTPQEELVLADQTAGNIIRRQQELEEFEKNRLQFMGQEAIFSTLVNQTIESGNYVSDVEILNLTETFIRDAFHRSRVECNFPYDGTYCLWVNDDLADYMRQYIVSKKKADLTAQEFLKALVPGKQLPLTFDHQMASQRKLLHFITLRHPLAQAALEYWKEKVDPAETFVRVGVNGRLPDGTRLRSGDYYFFLFTFQASGVEKISRLVSVVVLPEEGDIFTELSRQLLHLLQTSSTEISGILPDVDPSTLEAAQQSAMNFMTTQRDSLEQDIRRSNEALINARLLALSQSFDAKRRRLQEILGKVTEARIRRMYEGQLRNQNARFEARQKEIEAQRAVITQFSLSLRGLVRVLELG